MSLTDGLTEEEAVAISLWNNAAYQELLAQLGVSRAQLFDAGLLSDPQMVMFFPLGVKQLEFTIYQSLTVLWLRPVRLRAATLDLNQVSETMVQNGLNLIRDVRLAHAQLTLAQARVKLADEMLELQLAIAELSQKRLDAGDISELDFMNTQVDVRRVEADLARLARDRDVAREQLRILMGLAQGHDPFVAVPAEIDNQTDEPEVDYVKEALAMRPDLRAAELQVEAACQRLKLAELQFINLDAVYDANGRGLKGFESGPGMRITIPIFNGNQGAVAISDAQLQQALRTYITVRNQITLDVRTAQLQLRQARDNLRMLEQEIVPTLEQSMELAQKSFLNGGTDYFVVLLATQRFLDARTQQLQFRADVRTAKAQLDRSVGHRVSRTVATDSQEQQNPPEVPPAPVPADFETAGFEEPEQ